MHEVVPQYAIKKAVQAALTVAGPAMVAARSSTDKIVEGRSGAPLGSSRAAISRVEVLMRRWRSFVGFSKPGLVIVADRTFSAAATG